MTDVDKNHSTADNPRLDPVREEAEDSEPTSSGEMKNGDISGKPGDSDDLDSELTSADEITNGDNSDKLSGREDKDSEHRSSGEITNGDNSDKLNGREDKDSEHRSSGEMTNGDISDKLSGREDKDSEYRSSGEMANGDNSDKLSGREDKDSEHRSSGEMTNGDNSDKLSGREDKDSEHRRSGEMTNGGNSDKLSDTDDLDSENRSTSESMNSDNSDKLSNTDDDLGSEHRSTSKFINSDNSGKLSDTITTFEELMEVVGTHGRWNHLIIFLCSLSCLVTPMSSISYQFFGGTPDHWCRVPTLDQANWTQQQIITLAVPGNNSSGRHDNCLVHNYNYTAAAMLGFEAVMSDVSTVTLDGPDLIPCTSRVYNTSYVHSSIVTEWDLTCERRALYSTTQAVTQVGTLVGSICYGHIFNILGRRKGVLISVVLTLVVGFATVAAPNIQTFIFLKWLFQSVDLGTYMGCFVIAMEVCSVSQRTHVGSLFLIPWAVGYMILPGIAYLVRPWRWLQAAFSLPLFLNLIYFWLLPESPRWLILHNRHTEALKVVKTAGAFNHKTLPPDHTILAAMDNIRRKEQSNDDRKEGVAKVSSSIKDTVATCVRQLFLLLVTPEVRVKAVIVFYMWIATATIYYGVSLNSYNLSTDIYLYTFLSGVMEVLSYLLLWLGVSTLGRRKMLILLYFFCGASISILTGLMYMLQEVPVVVKVVLSLSGKISITATFGLIWFYTTELFSTKYRTRAIGEASMFARFGSMTSPYINDILGEVVVWGPSLVFSLTALLAAVLVSSLPETSKKKMPQGEDSINFSLKETIDLACA